MSSQQTFIDVDDGYTHHVEMQRLQVGFINDNILSMLWSKWALNSCIPN